ncbi:DMT family transporter [Pseudooceanicola algae]|uniref:Riboflavin transporter n=1 Tax=Pseudooceanicola algae TaxID=1537215 RepID=A0A418SCN4_9RHOB|nr:DMT family transporter [Pseudooceanicola algae]QPM89019.1 Riboflavin transporter [Pseudooceanicola algae]
METPHRDNPLLGITLMSAFCVVAPCADAVVKILGAEMTSAMILLFRFALQALLLLPLAILLRKPWPARGRPMRLTLLRTVLHMGGVYFMIVSLRYLPLADAIAIAFVMPFLTLIAGRLFLNEEIGPRRIAAVAVGFAGTLLVIQPSFAAVGLPALLPLLVAVNFTAFSLVTRQVARATDPIAMQALSGIMATVILLPVLLIGSAFGVEELALDIPPGQLWGLVLLTGIFGSFGHLLMTWSLRYAPASTLAPMQYLELPVTALVGWLVFREFPNGLALVGIAIIIGAGLYIILRERAIARAGSATPLPHPPSPPPAL